MARLVIKNGYLKGGKAASHLNHLVKYIATRDGVEKVSNAKALWNSTKKQQSLITQIIENFPIARSHWNMRIILPSQIVKMLLNLFLLHWNSILSKLVIKKIS